MVKPAYPFVIDQKPGLFLQFLLYRLFRSVPVNPQKIEDLRKLHRRGTLVYVIKYRSRLDFLLYHFRFRAARIPYPVIGFGFDMWFLMPLSRLFRVIGFYLFNILRYGRRPDPYQSGFLTETLRDKSVFILPIIDPAGFNRRFIYSTPDPFTFLLETQRTMDNPIYMVPLLALYHRGGRQGYSGFFNGIFSLGDKPGLLKKMPFLPRLKSSGLIDFGETLNLKTFMESQAGERPEDKTAKQIKALLLDRIEMRQRYILGPRPGSRDQLKEKVLGAPPVVRSIEAMSKGDPRQRVKMRKKANAYFEEMAADYNVAYVRFFSIFLKRLWKKIFTGIDVDASGLSRIREKTKRNAPLIYVPSHKSHVDYLVLNDVLYRHRMQFPRIAAGTNLSFWPVGHIFRKSGAFFIRRAFKGARLYATVFETYIKTLLQEGQAIEFFIEGGRSRTGKLNQPRTGFLAILLQAQKEGYCEDLLFVPTSIAYDRIIEEKAHLRELKGTAKERESLRQTLRARRFLKQKYGKIYLRFGNPISLKDYPVKALENAESGQQRLAYRFADSINQVTPVTSLALIASAVLSGCRHGFSQSQLTSTADTLLDSLKVSEAPLVPGLDQVERVSADTLSLLRSRGIVHEKEEPVSLRDGHCYHIEDREKPLLEYYKNTILHHFLPYGFVSVSLSGASRESKSYDKLLEDYTFLRWLFQYEFVYRQDKEPREEVGNAVAYFEHRGLIDRADPSRTYSLTEDGTKTMPLWSNLIKTHLESYWIATRSYLQHKDKGIKRRKMIRHIYRLGVELYKNGLIGHVEALSQLNFENAGRFIQTEILAGSSAGRPEGTETLALLSRKLYQWCRSGS